MVSGGKGPFSRSLNDSLQRTALYRPLLNSAVVAAGTGHEESTGGDYTWLKVAYKF